MKKKKYSEKYLEKKLREEVKKLGGLALKFQSQSYTGMPDRLIILDGMGVMWAEIKSTGKKQTPEQKARARMLESMGHLVFVIDNLESLEGLLSKIKEYIVGSEQLEQSMDLYLSVTKQQSFIKCPPDDEIGGDDEI